MLSVCLSVCLSVRLPVCLSDCLSVCPFATLLESVVRCGCASVDAVVDAVLCGCVRAMFLFFLGGDDMSPVRGGGYGTCPLAHRARPISNIEWRLQQDVNRRCFTMQQGVSRRCHTSPPLPHNGRGTTSKRKNILVGRIPLRSGNVTSWSTSTGCQL